MTHRDSTWQEILYAGRRAGGALRSARLDGRHPWSWRFDRDHRGGASDDEGDESDILGAVVEIAYEFGRPVVGQIWFTDDREAASLRIDQLDNYSRIAASGEYPPEGRLAYQSKGERLSLTAGGRATISWDLTEPIREAMVEHGRVVLSDPRRSTAQGPSEGHARGRLRLSDLLR
jgi:hypothetical protein